MWDKIVLENKTKYVLIAANRPALIFGIERPRPRRDHAARNTNNVRMCDGYLFR